MTWSKPMPLNFSRIVRRKCSRVQASKKWNLLRSFVTNPINCMINYSMWRFLLHHIMSWSWLFAAYFGRISDPWHKIDPMPNQSALDKVNCVSISSGSLTQGCGLSHSYGVILYLIQDSNSKVFDCLIISLQEWLQNKSQLQTLIANHFVSSTGLHPLIPCPLYML